MSNVISLEDFKRRKKEKQMSVPTAPAPQTLVTTKIDAMFSKYYLGQDPKDAKAKVEADRKRKNEQVKKDYQLNRPK